MVITGKQNGGKQMKALRFPGFSEINLKAPRTDSYPVPTRKVQSHPRSIQLQEKAFMQAKRQQLRQPRQTVSDTHRAILTNYSLDRRFFW
jgi:hypothetical protein